MASGFAPGYWDQFSDQYVIDDGTMCRQVSPKPGYLSFVPSQSRSTMTSASRRTFNKILDTVDSHEDLQGMGIIMRSRAGEALMLRDSGHPSELATYIRFDVKVLAKPADQRTWWGKWGDSVKNCGGAAISVGSFTAGLLAEVPTVGASTPVTYLSGAAALAGSAQCYIAVRKEVDPDFTSSKLVDYSLDAIGLFGGIGGAVAALKGGSELMNISKIAGKIDLVPKGSVLKVLGKLGENEGRLDYFRQAVAKLIETKKVLDPVARGFSNNLMQRSLPFILKSIRLEKISSAGSIVGQALSTYVSGESGVIKASFHLLQQTILDLAAKDPQKMPTPTPTPGPTPTPPIRPAYPSPWPTVVPR